MFDSSPVAGVELFAVREFVYADRAVGSGRDRCLPLGTLGLGHFGGVDKAAALLHSISLEVGIQKEGMQQFLDSVRITLPDSGAEHLINDVVDMLDICLAGEVAEASIEGLRGSYLFKYSLWVPEVNHVLGPNHATHASCYPVV